MAANDVNIRIRAVDDTDKAFRSVKSSLGGLKNAVFSVQGAIAGIISGATIGTIVQANRSFQSLQASLITFTGSAEAASKQFEILQEFASKTPFSLEEVVGGFNKLVARGISPTIDSFAAFGDIASGTGKSLDQFIEAVADAATGEFERLKEFGITSKSEGNKVAITFGGITKTIGKNSTEILAYLENLAKVNFAGATVRQANTLNGAFSNFGDSVSKLSVAIGEAGLNDFLVTATREMSRLINVTAQATKANLGLIDVIGITLREAFSGATESLKIYREELETLRKGRSILDFLGFDLTNSNKEIDDVQKKINILLMSERTSSRGMGFADPRIIKSPVKASPSTQDSGAVKNVKTYIDEINDAIAGAIRGSDVVRAKELADQIKALDNLYFEAGLSAEIYDSAMRKLTGSTGSFSEKIDKVKNAVDSFISDNALTRGDKMIKQIEELDKRFFDGDITIKQYDAAMTQMTGTTKSFGEQIKKSPLKEFADGIKTVEDSMQDIALGGLMKLEDGLVGLINGTKSASDAFRDMANNIINDMIRMVIQQSITAPLAGALSGAISGMFGGASAPAIPSAIGGSVQSGRTHLVGERGPELFIPSASGSIVPNNAMGGGGITVVQNINVSTGVQQTVRAEIMTLMPQISNAAKSAVAEARLRGGSFSAAMR
jgi:hypothetical protein